MNRKPFVLALALVGMSVLAPHSGVWGFHRDTHYHLRFTLALSTCFDWDEAHLVASGDWMLDQNATTVAEMNPVQKANKIGWHSFGHSEARLNELWLRALDEPDPQRQLVKIGQLMHFLEDWEAHAGFGVRLGHAKATLVGKDPDSLGRSTNRNRAMVQTGLVHLIRICGELGRPVVGTEDPDLALARLLQIIERDRLLEDLFSESDPKWLKGNAKLGEQGMAILNNNQARAEQFIAQHLQNAPSFQSAQTSQNDQADQASDKKIPADFAPGSSHHGMPPPLRLRYDKRGELVLPPEETTRGAEAALAQVGLNLAEIVTTTAPFDLVLEVTSAVTEDEGWKVGFELTNLGPEDSDAGNVEFLVADAGTEQVLGEVSLAVGRLNAEETLQAEVLVPASSTSQPVVIGGYAAIDDTSAESNQSWYSPSGDLSMVEANEQLRGAGREQIVLANQPRIVVLEDRVFCTLVRAYTSGGDASEKLGAIEITLLGEDGSAWAGTKVAAPAWCAVEAAKDGRVLAQTVVCTTSEMGLCPRSDSPHLAEMSIAIDSNWSASLLVADLPTAAILTGLDDACRGR